MGNRNDTMESAYVVFDEMEQLSDNHTWSTLDLEFVTLTTSRQTIPMTVEAAETRRMTLP